MCSDMKFARRGLAALFGFLFLLVAAGCKTTDDAKKWDGLSKKADTVVADSVGIQGISHVLTQEGEKVSLVSDQPLVYRVFTLSNPTRLVLEFPKAVLGPAVQPVVLNKGSLTGLYPSETGKGGSQLEVTMEMMLEYEVRERDDGLDIVFISNPGRGAHGKAAVSDLVVSHRRGHTDLRLLGQGVVTTPKAFRLNNPPRLVLDMAGVAGPGNSRRFAIDSLHAVNARLVGGTDKTRLVVELTDVGVGFSLGSEAGMPVLRLGHDIRTAARSGVAAASAASGVYGVNFTREGQGALVGIKVNKKGGPLKIKRDGAIIRLSIADTPVAPHLVRRMDVRAFGGPVTFVDTEFREKGAHLGITLQDIGSRHEVLEKSGEILVRVHPAPQKTVEEASPYTGSKVSLDFKEIDIQNALRVIAEVSDLNIILSDSVSGTLTMRLVDVPWDQALELILEAKGLGQVKQGNVLRIAPVEEIQATSEAKQKARQSARRLEPFVTELIPVSFADGAKLSKLLTEGNQQNGAGMVSAGGSISLDARTNTLIVTDTAANIARIKDMVDKLDRPIPQVLIEARIVEIDRESRDEFGINWGFAAKRGSDYGIADTSANAYTASQATDSGARLTTSASQNVALPTDNAAIGQVGVYLGGISPWLDLDIEIAALENDDKAKTISSPRVMTTNNQKATIRQGVKVPYTVTQDGVPITTFINAELSLEVTPQVTPNDYITLKILATNNSVTGSGTTLSVSTKEVDTQALVDNGETIVLGGIYQDIQNRNTDGVPGLNKLPFIGWMFENHANYDKRTELLIFITPHIIKPRQ